MKETEPGQVPTVTGDLGGLEVAYYSKITPTACITAGRYPTGSPHHPCLLGSSAVRETTNTRSPNNRGFERFGLATFGDIEWGPHRSEAQPLNAGMADCCEPI